MLPDKSQLFPGDAQVERSGLDRSQFAALAHLLFNAERE